MLVYQIALKLNKPRHVTKYGDMQKR